MDTLLNLLNENDYSIECELSSGAHGTCYLVRKNNIGYILKNYECDAEKESLHEAEVYKELHGNGKGNEYFFKAEHKKMGNRHFLLSETYEGVTLEEYILTGKEKSFENILDILLRTCRAIKEMHTMTPPYLHLDIKPSNLYVSLKENIVRPIDMGSAVRKTGRKTFADIINDMGYRSTDSYATMKVKVFNNLRDEYLEMDALTEEQNELCSLEEKIGVADDIYSLLCCFFFMITKKKFKYWIDESFSYNDSDEIESALKRNNAPSYLIDRLSKLFMCLIAPYTDEEAEVPYKSIDDFINELDTIKLICGDEGFHHEIIDKNFINYFNKNLMKFIDEENGFDSNLIADLEKA